ncbi:MAG: SMC-Scp complex subunit ScpB [Acidobacteria bacterium]|nr:SMC-Scp complex subunit ScpB [Acidobacteriota bacterium]
MSLKSKLEAVIYASEEPVTLAQLATLFGAEAVEWETERKAAEEAAAQRAAAAAAAASVDPTQPIVAEGLDYIELRTEDGTLVEQPGFAVLPASETAEEQPSDPQAGTESTMEVAQEAASLAQEPDSSEPPAPNEFVEPQTPDAAPLDPEAEAKRLARQRDRDIKAILRQLIDELITDYANDERGIEIREIAGGYRMATKPECHDAVRMFIKSLKPPLKLSLPALETLAVIAYKQPVTAPEVNEIRGVDSSGVFGSLLARKLITTAGRKQVIGRPILYKTTKEFLMRFGLKDVNELPSMDEFEKMASELEEAEPTPITDPEAAEAYDTEGDYGPELDENAPEEPDGESPPPENSAPTPEPALESNSKTEPAE